MITPLEHHFYVLCCPNCGNTDFKLYYSGDVICDECSQWFQYNKAVEKFLPVIPDKKPRKRGKNEVSG